MVTKMEGMEFRVATHMGSGKPMAELWKNGQFIAGIYPHQDGLRIVSKYLDGVEHQPGYPPSVAIRFSK